MVPTHILAYKVQHPGDHPKGPQRGPKHGLEGVGQPRSVGYCATRSHHIEGNFFPATQIHHEQFFLQLFSTTKKKIFLRHAQQTPKFGRVIFKSNQNWLNGTIVAGVLWAL